MYFKVRRGRSDEAAPTQTRRNSLAASHLEVRMFNVGSGEAVLVVFPNDRVWIVDCGSGNHWRGDNRILGQGLAAYLASERLTLEAMIASHPHIDHGGAFRWLLDDNPDLAPQVWFFRAAENWTEGQWKSALAARLANINVDPIVLIDSHRVVELDQVDATAHLFAAHGDDAYTSVWLHLRYRDTAIMFTGDVHCPYEKDILRMFGDYDFTSDVLKVTHHGSSSGTSTAFVSRVQHGMTIASSDDHSGHRLEADTLRRLGGMGQPRRVFETGVDGDIIVRTDGNTFGDGILYQVDFDTPGEFAQAIGSDQLVTLAQLNPHRDDDPGPGCVDND